MSNVGQEIFSPLSGSYLLESKLQNIRGKLSAINSAVRRLESNMIFLLVNPGLVTYNSSQGSDDNVRYVKDIWGNDEEHSVVLSSPRIDYGQEQFITDPVELSGQYAEQMSIRHSLMVSEREISDTIDEQKKKMNYKTTDSTHNHKD